jgi:hypothetical protein
VECLQPDSRCLDLKDESFEFIENSASPCSYARDMECVTEFSYVNEFA